MQWGPAGIFTFGLFDLLFGGAGETESVIRKMEIRDVDAGEMSPSAERNERGSYCNFLSFLSYRQEGFLSGFRRRRGNSPVGLVRQHAVRLSVRQHVAQIEGNLGASIRKSDRLLCFLGRFKWQNNEFYMSLTFLPTFVHYGNATTE